MSANTILELSELAAPEECELMHILVVALAISACAWLSESPVFLSVLLIRLANELQEYYTDQLDTNIIFNSYAESLLGRCFHGNISFQLGGALSIQESLYSTMFG